MRSMIDLKRSSVRIAVFTMFVFSEVVAAQTNSVFYPLGDLLGPLDFGAGGGIFSSSAELMGDNLFGGVPVVGTVVGDPVAFLTILPDTGLSFIASPQSIVNSVLALGLPTFREFVPVAAVLMDDPTSLADFFLGGGTILTSALPFIPPVPLLSDRLPGLE